ncbi:MAG: BTAD domain-containing putative transcriptional regulator [Anaerolineae bacterium]
MGHLAIRLLGPLHVTLDGNPVTAFESDKVRALLAYLVVESSRPHRREALAGLLWPEWPERAARANLRRALSNLRKSIGDHRATPPFLRISRQAIQFNRASDAWCDVTAFTALLEPAEAPERTTCQLEKAVELYRGDFLMGFSIGDSAAFEEWGLLTREQLQRQALATLHSLATLHEGRGECELALLYAWRRVELAPWQEEAHRQLMRLLALNRQRSAALAQYEACRRALDRELGVEPSPDTVRLYKQIRDGEVADVELARPRTLAHKAGNSEAALPAQPVPAAPDVSDGLAPPPPFQRGSSRRSARTRLTLVGGGLLLLAVAAVLMLLAGSGRWGTRFSLQRARPRAGVGSPPETGRLLQRCDGIVPPQICVGDFRTGQITQVTDNLTFDAIGGFAWSPDGQAIVFDAGSDIELAQRRDHKLYTIHADGSGLRQVTGGESNDVMPAWSPDGQWIAFHRSCGLWIVRPDGSEAHSLLGMPQKFCVGAIAWSPDSHQIAFLYEIDKGVATVDELWVMNRDGTAPRVVHSFERPVAGGILAWSPDGRQIVSRCGFEDGEEALLLFSADGSGEPQAMDDIPWSWFANFWPAGDENR